MLNGLDLFSGIGGISLALEPWVRPIAYCENDRYAQAVLLSRMQDGTLGRAPIWDDVRTLSRDALGDVEIDIVFGGFPCQDISVAGHGVGLDGQRSGLYWELHRLVVETKPAFVFLENVPAIRTRGLETVVRSLADFGYDCRWTTVSAAEVGAAHKRRRWFLLAHAHGKTLRFEQGRGGGTSRGISALDSPNGDTRLAPWTREGGFESGVFGTGDGIPFAVDRDRCLGNSVVPAAAREAFQRLIGMSAEKGPL